MSVALPPPIQLRSIAQQCGLSLTDEDVASFRGLMQGTLQSYNLVAAMPDELPLVKYPRTPGYRPSPDENPRNAWYRKTTIQGAASGKLKGKTVALKDNIMLAGVPMMNGCATLEGYVPDFDATIVTRMLDAGAEIGGKVHCEAFCLSGGSHTNATGPVHNPHKMGYSEFLLRKWGCGRARRGRHGDRRRPRRLDPHAVFVLRSLSITPDRSRRQ